MAGGTQIAHPQAAPRFVHEAAFYAGPQAQPAALVPFVRDGIALGEPVLVALAPERSERLRAALGPDSAGVEFIDMTDLGANPARIIPRWREFLADHAGRPGRGIGEPAWPGRRDVELVETALHESLLNLAFDGGPGWRLLCPYDVTTLSPDVIDEARRNHPRVIPAPSSEQITSPTAYAGAGRARTMFAQALPPEPAGCRDVAFAAGDLTALRERVRSAGNQAQLGRDRVEDLVLAAHEMATNSTLHGEGHGRLLWWEEPDALIVEVRDSGRIEDPLVGRSLVDPSQQKGRGVWMANQLCDFVQVRSGAAGTQVRLWSWR